MKVGLIIMTLTTMITMNACSKMNDATANDVCTALSEKYGESFVAIKIGDRFNTDSAKLYVHPAKNENLIFTARINKDSGKVEDNYIRSIIANEIEEEIKSSVDSSDLKCGFSVTLMCQDTSNEADASISFEKFAEKYSLSGIAVYVPIKSSTISDQTVEDIISTFKKANDKFSVSVSAMLYSISDENFEKCMDDMTYYPDLTSTWFDSFGVNGTATISVKDGSVSPDISKIIKSLVGE